MAVASVANDTWIPRRDRPARWPTMRRPWNGRHPTRGPLRHHRSPTITAGHPQNQRRYLLLVNAAAHDLPPVHRATLQTLATSRSARNILQDVTITQDQLLDLLVPETDQRPGWGQGERTLRRILHELAEWGWLSIADVPKRGRWPICSYRFHVPHRWVETWVDICRNAETARQRGLQGHMASRAEKKKQEPARPQPPPFTPGDPVEPVADPRRFIELARPARARLQARSRAGP